MATMQNLIERVAGRRGDGHSIDDLADEIIEMLRTSLSNETAFHARLGYYMCWPEALEPAVRRKFEVILNGGNAIADCNAARSEDDIRGGALLRKA